MNNIFSSFFASSGTRHSVLPPLPVSPISPNGVTKVKWPHHYSDMAGMYDGSKSIDNLIGVGVPMAVAGPKMNQVFTKQSHHYSDMAGMYDGASLAGNGISTDAPFSLLNLLGGAFLGFRSPRPFLISFIKKIIEILPPVLSWGQSTGSPKLHCLGGQKQQPNHQQYPPTRTTSNKACRYSYGGIC